MAVSNARSSSSFTLTLPSDLEIVMTRVVDAPRRLVFRGPQQARARDALVGPERLHATTLTSTLLFESVEDRDGMLNSGMEEGATQTLDRLAEHLETMS